MLAIHLNWISVWGHIKILGLESILKKLIFAFQQTCYWFWEEIRQNVMDRAELWLMPLE